jgi:hypothetical protein
MNPDRIIVERLHDHCSAWFDGEPQIAFEGATPAEAVDRLVGFATVAAGGLTNGAPGGTAAAGCYSDGGRETDDALLPN